MIYSVIDIGSNSIDLKIVSFNGTTMKPVDEITMPVTMGSEVYTTSYISRESVLTLVDILRRYKRMMRDYSTDHHRVVATGMFQNSKNAKQVIEIVRMHTGLEIEIYEGPVENYITYMALRDKLPHLDEIRQGAVVVDVHSGSTDITIYSKGKLITNDNVKMGTQIAVPYLETLMAITGEYPVIMQDYISTLIRRVQKKMVHRKSDYLLLMGTDVSEFCSCFFDGKRELTKEDFRIVFEKVRNKDYELERKAGENWLKFVYLTILYGLFLESTEANQILIPEITLSDGMIANLIDATMPSHARYEAAKADIFDAAAEIAKRFKCKIKHIRNVEANALLLFDEVASLLDLTEEDRFILRLSAHIVEIGKALKRSRYERATYDMLKHLDLFGVSRSDLDLVGRIALEIENIFSSEINRAVYNIRSRKIAVILAVGLALDTTNLQHIRIEEVRIEENTKESTIRENAIEMRFSGSDIASTKIAFESVRSAFADCTGYNLELLEDVCY